MKLKYLIFGIIFVLCPFHIFAQGSENANLPDIIAPTPKVAELGKYGNYPIALNTGTPEIKFDLFDVSINEISIPFSLSYHPSGIKVNQEATEVGLGWNILGGGVIHRNVMGVPDESNQGNFVLPALTVGEVIALYAGTGQQKDDNFYKLQAMARSAGRDTGPDLFSYNIPNKSGKFIYKRDREYMTMPHEPIKIVQDNGGSYNFYFTIIDDQGTTYRFGGAGTNKIMIDDNSNPLHNYIKDWYLTEVISNNKKDTVHFKYETVGYSKTQTSEQQVIGREFYSPTYGDLDTRAMDGFIDTKTNYTVQQEKLIKEITYKKGKIVFNYNDNRLDRQDVNALLLENISIYDFNEVLVKRFQFSYGYFQSNFYPFQDQPSFYRLKLLGFSEVANDSSTDVKSYDFEYETAIPIPHIGAYSQDFWGLFNGKTNYSLIPTKSVNGSEIQLDGMTLADKSSTWSVGNADRSVDVTKMQMCMLKKIIIPTRGYTEFEYEPHAYLSDLDTSPTIEFGGGLRISKIRNYSADSELASLEEYKYGVGENGIGEKVFDEELLLKNYDDSVLETFEFNICSGWIKAWQRRYLGVEAYSAMNYNGNPVIYKEVNKYTGIDPLEMNRTKYEYDLLVDTGAWDEFVNSSNYGTYNIIWNRPNLKYETLYKNNGNGYDSIKRNEFKYHSFYNDQEYGIILKEKSKYVEPGQTHGKCDYYQPGSGPEPTFVIATDFLYRSKAYRIQQKKEISFFPDSMVPVENSTSYFYDNPDHMQVTRTETTNSDGRHFIKNYYYPEDVESIASLGSPNLSLIEKQAIDRLKSSDLHHLSYPLQTETIIKSEGGAVLAQTMRRTVFRDRGDDLIKPGQIGSLKGIYSSNANEFQDEIHYTEYDDLGRLIEMVRADGETISYIWGYKQLYPVAMVQNATRSQIDALSGFGSMFNSGDGGLSTAQEYELRNNLPDNPMVTTYRHKPMVGVASITDPKGNSIFYYYDNFNRLEEVRDQDNKLMVDYRYHYKTNP